MTHSSGQRIICLLRGLLLRQSQMPPAALDNGKGQAEDAPPFLCSPSLPPFPHSIPCLPRFTPKDLLSKHQATGPTTVAKCLVPWMQTAETAAVWWGLLQTAMKSLLCDKITAWDLVKRYMLLEAAHIGDTRPGRAYVNFVTTNILFALFSCLPVCKCTETWAPRTFNPVLAPCNCI